MRRAEVIDGLERNWREEKRLIDEKSINNRRTEAERATRTAEKIDGLERTWREEKLLINEKSRNNRWTGAERPSKNQAGRTTTVNRQEKSTWNLTPPYIWIAYNSNIASRPAQ